MGNRYRFYASSTTSQPVWFTTCDNFTNFDTYLRVYTQELDALTGQYRFVQVAYNDDDYSCTVGNHSRQSLSSNVSLTMSPGTYYVLVEGFSSHTGTFALHTHCGGPAPPPPPATAPLQCVRMQSTSNGVPYGRYFYRYVNALFFRVLFLLDCSFYCVSYIH